MTDTPTLPPLISVKPGKLSTTVTDGTRRLHYAIVIKDSTSLGAFCPALLALDQLSACMAL